MRTLLTEYAVASLAMLSLGCIAQTLDLRNIEEPVVLNGASVLGGSDSGRWTAVGRYHGTVTDTRSANTSTAGNTTTTTSSAALVNDAQEQAFLEIGGHENRAITNVEIDVAASAVNLLNFIRTQIDIDAWGVVVELMPVEEAVEEAAVSGEVER
jgi:hypothetical protein